MKQRNKEKLSASVDFKEDLIKSSLVDQTMPSTKPEFFPQRDEVQDGTDRDHYTSPNSETSSKHPRPILLTPAVPNMLYLLIQNLNAVTTKDAEFPNFISNFPVHPGMCCGANPYTFRETPNYSIWKEYIVHKSYPWFFEGNPCRPTHFLLAHSASKRQSL